MMRGLRNGTTRATRSGIVDTQQSVNEGAEPVKVGRLSANGGVSGGVGALNTISGVLPAGSVIGVDRVVISTYTGPDVVVVLGFAWRFRRGGLFQGLNFDNGDNVVPQFKAYSGRVQLFQASNAEVTINFPNLGVPMAELEVPDPTVTYTSHIGEAGRVFQDAIDSWIWLVDVDKINRTLSRSVSDSEILGDVRNVTKGLGLNESFFLGSKIDEDAGVVRNS